MKTKTEKTKGARSLTVTLAIAFFTLSAIVLLVNGGLAIYTNYLSYNDTVSIRQQLIAQNASKIVANSIEEKFAGMETAVTFANPVLADTAARKTFMESLLSLHPSFRNFALLNKQGRLLDQVTRFSLSLPPQFILQLKGDSLTQTIEGKRYISPVYIDDVTSEPLIAIAIPVKNVFGDYQGTLVGEVNLKFMWDLVDQLEVGKTGYVYIVDNQGKLIAYEDTSRVLTGENVGQVSEVKDFLENPSLSANITPDVASYTGLTGKTVFGTFVPLGSPQWAVVTELPTAEANQPIYQSLVSSIATILVFAVLAGLAGVFVARRLSAPLVDLSNIATEIGSGNLALQAKVAGPAEIGNVAAAFNTMTTRLRELISSLEQRVADRTKALATSSEVSRRLSTILNQKELVTEVVDQVNNAFGYYHTQIYFFDEAKANLVMAGGTGEAGKLMLAQFHKVAKGRGLVGRAAQTNEAILVSDTSQNPEWLPNPLLPDTKSEIAIPISIGSQVLGVLDVQQNIKDGLKREDVDSLQSIANQVAVAMQNIRQYGENLQFKLGIENSGDAVFITDTNGTITYANPAFEKIYGYAPSEAVGQNPRIFKSGLLKPENYQAFWGALLSKNSVTGDIVNKHRDGRLVYIAGTNSAIVNNAGEITGFLAVHHDITEQRKNQELVAKNASQQEAINLITQRIQNTTSVEAALQMAARELGHALGMRQTLVELDSTALAEDPKGTGVSK